MGRLVFKVMVPAMMPGQLGAPMPDPMPSYMGAPSPTGHLPPFIGGAIIVGGTKIGNKWMGCTYTKPPFAIPGFGEVEEQSY